MYGKRKKNLYFDVRDEIAWVAIHVRPHKHMYYEIIFTLTLCNITGAK